jgi:hypothetical protein
VLGAATAANSLFKTGVLLNSFVLFYFERNPKREIPDTIPHARCRALPKRGVLGAATAANSLFKT